MRDVTETVARAIWRASALNLSGERDLDAEFDAFSEYDKADRRATAIKLVRELAAAGFVIVPRKPTDAMKTMGGLDLERIMFEGENPPDLIFDVAAECYRAMLDAVPKIGGEDA